MEITKTPTRSWIFKAEVSGVFPRRPIQVADCEIRVDLPKEKTSRVKCVASSKIEAKTLGEAAVLANEKINRVFMALSIATGWKFEYKIVGSEEVTPNAKEKEGMLYATLEGITVKTFQPQAVEQAERLVELVRKPDSIS